MRWTGWLIVVGILGAAGSAVGHQPGCASCNGLSSSAWWSHRGLDAEPCAFTCGYGLAPGCCEETRHCCDNAWAGYCEHRARVEAFWARVGTGAACGHRRYCQPVSPMPCYGCGGSTETGEPTRVGPVGAGPTPAPPQPAEQNGAQVAARTATRRRYWPADANSLLASTSTVRFSGGTRGETEQALLRM